MKNIYLDTNFILIPAQFKVDIYTQIRELMFEPYRLCVLQTTLDEIELIKSRGGKGAIEAKLAESVLKKQKDLNITPFSNDIGVDQALISLADDKTIIATQDQELKRLIKEKGGHTLTLRQKKYLIIT